MKVFVAGSTGAIGRYVVAAAVGAGHEVTALVRTEEKAAVVRARGARPVTASLFDRDELSAAIAGHDAVVNMASALPSVAQFMSDRAWRRNEHVRIDGSTALVDAALAAGVDRLIQESVSMIYPDSGAEWITEDVPADRYPRAVCSIVAEDNAHRLTAAGGSGIVLRFGVFCGVGAAHSEQMLAMARRHIAPVLGRADAYISTIHLADAAAAVVAALTAPAGTYNIVDDEPLTKREYATALAAAAGKRPWLRVPGRAALLGGHRLTSLTRSLRVSNNRFRAATNWSPRYPSAREAWLATAAPVGIGSSEA
ncbi:NAD-dependent epimerase/dehydratase family protein [Nocardia abscessus]|uniref:NAD-dependent epimerase/dehydratase family protein n=1 Tax=Nocardia abscessus TaxID=120957 RepID=UPI002456FCF7|nr:NAD(P)-dependent oxidoreductase [Nocardia abscessus]